MVGVLTIAAATPMSFFLLSTITTAVAASRRVAVIAITRIVLPWRSRDFPRALGFARLRRLLRLHHRLIPFGLRFTVRLCGVRPGISRRCGTGVVRRLVLASARLQAFWRRRATCDFLDRGRGDFPAGGSFYHRHTRSIIHDHALLATSDDARLPFHFVDLCSLVDDDRVVHHDR